MKEHPILFKPEMIRAILDGRKSQTRRLGERWKKVQPGDRLWVRETWKVEAESNYTPDGKNGIKRIYIGYRAGLCAGTRQQRSEFMTPRDDELALSAWGKNRSGTWRPSIFMPRWASRLLIEVLDNRRQHLQEITPMDAIAEGCFCDGSYATDGVHPYPVASFIRLWDSINVDRAPWSSNPEVSAITFRRLP